MRSGGEAASESGSSIDGGEPCFFSGAAAASHASHGTAVEQVLEEEGEGAEVVEGHQPVQRLRGSLAMQEAVAAVGSGLAAAAVAGLAAAAAAAAAADDD